METETSPGNGQQRTVEAPGTATTSPPTSAIPDGPPNPPLAPATERPAPASASLTEEKGPSGAPAAAHGAGATAAGWKPWSQDGLSPTDYQTYKQGDTSPFNTKITRVFGRSRDYLV